VTTAVDKWPAYARLLAVAPAGHLPTAPTPRRGTRPQRRPGLAAPKSLRQSRLPVYLWSTRACHCRAAQHSMRRKMRQSRGRARLDKAGRARRPPPRWLYPSSSRCRHADGAPQRFPSPGGAPRRARSCPRNRARSFALPYGALERAAPKDGPGTGSCVAITHNGDPVTEACGPSGREKSPPDDPEKLLHKHAAALPR